jgi:hypothetical protein
VSAKELFPERTGPVTTTSMLRGAVLPQNRPPCGPG